MPDAEPKYAEPGVVHPYYAPVNVTQLIELARKQGGRILVPKPRYIPMVSQGDGTNVTAADIETIELRLQTYTGPAPSVGPSAYYEWEALVDDQGRYIAQPAGTQKRVVSPAELSRFWAWLLELRAVEREALRAWDALGWMKEAPRIRQFKELYDKCVHTQSRVEELWEHIVAEQREQHGYWSM